MQTTSKPSRTWLKYEALIPIVLFLSFIFITLPGISWGAPDLWHPDEILKEALQALEGDYQFDEENFDYPSLPKYVLYGMGKAVYSLGYSKADLIRSARGFSVILGGLTVALTYGITRLAGGGVPAAMLGSLLVASSSEMALNARFAHNDPYLAFFSLLTVAALLQYQRQKGKGWLYLSFLTVGLAASSKYNGASLLLAPLVVYLLTKRSAVFEKPLESFETLFVGLGLSGLGYALGTPKALLWMAYYIKRAAPAILRHASYAREPGSLIGLLGQWKVLSQTLGFGVFLLLIGALLWHAARLIQSAWRSKGQSGSTLEPIAVLMLAILALDLPILVSYNYQPRFFLPLIPLLASLAGLFTEELYRSVVTSRRKLLALLIVAGVVALITFSFLRVLHVALLFRHDARIPASEYLKSLPVGATIEYTLYPPSLPEGHFSRKHNYPIFFKKFPGQELPTSRLYQFNQGEAGLEERQTDYLVIDSFTYERFEDEFICASHQVECDFFNRLRAGKTRYRLLRSFHYETPTWLPDLRLPFVNPDIEVYQRIAP